MTMGITVSDALRAPGAAGALVSAGVSRVDSPKRGNPPRRPPPAGRRWGIHLAGLWASGLPGFWPSAGQCSMRQGGRPPRPTTVFPTRQPGTPRGPLIVANPSSPGHGSGLGRVAGVLTRAPDVEETLDFRAHRQAGRKAALVSPGFRAETEARNWRPCLPARPTVRSAALRLCCPSAFIPVCSPARPASARLPALLLVCSTIHVPAFQIKHNICTC